MSADPQSAPAGAGPLAGLRVVELGDGTAGPYAAKLLGDFGAEVLKIEGPQGDSSRRRGPFAGDLPDPEASGLFHYLNTNKQGVVLDLDAGADRATLERLLAAADVFVTNLAPRRLRATGLAPAALRARHPRLIVTCIAPFGATGDWAARRGDELVSCAMGGMAYSTPGMPDAAADLAGEPPLHPDCDVAETVSGLIAATATLSALHRRARSGAGCHVDLSQQAAVAALQHRDVSTHAYLGGRFDRTLNPVNIGLMPNFYLPCRDGHVVLAAFTEVHWQGLVEAMGNPSWALGADFSTSAARRTHWVELRRRLEEWTRSVTGDELYALAQRKQMPVFPFYPVRRLADCAQVLARGSLVPIELGGRRARMPGAPLSMRDTPWSLRRGAPRLGADAAGSVAAWLAGAPRPTDRAAAAADATRLPLAGVRVLDVGQFIAIPFCTLWLAWLGAEVIVVESARRMAARVAQPIAPGCAGHPDGSGYFNQLYSGKKSITVDMTMPEGRELVRRLAGVVDVLVDNSATGVLEKLGLGYDVVSAANPRIIVASCGAFGRSGPMAHARGLHSAVNLFSGVADVTGYAGGKPRILGGVLPDPLTGIHANFAIQAALLARERSGRGQYIDLAMYEAMLTLIPAAVIDYTLNGRDPVRIGNRDRVKAPHGIYPCRAPDSWIAISVDGDADWAALCRAAGRADWAADARFAAPAARRANADALDQALVAWTRGIDLEPAVEALQQAGVAAGPVQRCDELLDDPRLRERGMVIEIDHPVVGKRRQLGLPWRMDGPAFAYGRAPLLGEHSRAVLAALAGIGDDEYARLAAAGVLT